MFIKSFTSRVYVQFFYIRIGRWFIIHFYLNVWTPHTLCDCIQRCNGWFDMEPLWWCVLSGIKFRLLFLCTLPGVWNVAKFAPKTGDYTAKSVELLHWCFPWQIEGAEFYQYGQYYIVRTGSVNKAVIIKSFALWTWNLFGFFFPFSTT